MANENQPQTIINTPPDRWTKIFGTTLKDIYSLLSKLAGTISGRDYSFATDTARKVPVNRHRYSLEVSDREFRHAEFQQVIAEMALFRRYSGGFGEDFYEPQDSGESITAQVDTVLGRCITNVTTPATTKVFATRLVTNWATYTNVYLSDNSQLNSGTLEYRLISGANNTVLTVNANTVVPAIGATCYIKVTLTNSGTGVSPDLRQFWACARLAATPANATVYAVDYNEYQVR